MRVFDVGCGLSQRHGERRPARGCLLCRRRVEPFPELTLLAARQPAYLMRVVGFRLQQRRCLQHGVMDRRGALGALLPAEARATFGGELTNKPPQPWARDEQYADQ